MRGIEDCRCGKRGFRLTVRCFVPSHNSVRDNPFYVVSPEGSKERTSISGLAHTQGTFAVAVVKLDGVPPSIVEAEGPHFP
jgi:hypothetical protein